MLPARFRLARGSWIVYILSSVFLVLLGFLAARQFRGAKEDTATPKTKAQTKVPETTTAQTKIPEKEIAPETLVKELVLAWNRGDAERIAGLFVPNGVLITPTGSEIRSRPEIRKTISEQRDGRLKETTLTNTVDDISLQDVDTAVVKGSYRLDGIKLLGVSSSSSGSYVFRQTKQDGRWMIAKAEVLRK